MANAFNAWDMPGLNFRNPVMTPPGMSTLNNNLFNSGAMLNTPLGRVQSAPALPPRPAHNNSLANNYSSYSSFSSPYSSFGGYGGYSSGYGGFGLGGYRPGFGSYGYSSPGYYNNAYPENRFIQLAEESSRPAFQSIQSILQALSSVTMMFESTFHAIHSSYMSVLGVADNFGKLRSLFGQVFSMFAVIRTLNWIFRKLLYLIGIRKDNPMTDEIWSAALNEAAGLSQGGQGEQQEQKRPTWAVLMFLSVIVAGPYLLFKLISQLHPSPVQEIWNPAENPGSLAVGLYDFSAASEQELGFSTNQRLMVAPKKFQRNDFPGWVLACNENRKVGLIPSNYVGAVMHSEKTGQTYIDHNGRKYSTGSRVPDIRTESVAEEFKPSAEKILKPPQSEDVGQLKPIIEE